MADNNQDPNNAPNKFVGIPIEELVAAPLVAVCDSQKKLAQSAYEFMTEIGFNDEGKTRMVEFNLQRPIQGASQPQDIKVQVTFLGLVPLPNLLINDVQVDFQTEVTTTETSEEKSASEGSTNANANFKFGCFGGGIMSVSVSGNVVSNNENTNTSDQSAKHKVNVSELNSHQLEGLTKIIELLTESLDSMPREKE